MALQRYNLQKIYENCMNRHDFVSHHLSGTKFTPSIEMKSKNDSKC